jgi:hypothetical protein
MNEKEKQILLLAVAHAVEDDPQMFVRIIQASQNGLEVRASEATDRASDFELSTACLLQYIAKGQRNKKGNLALALDKIGKWKNRTSTNWPFFQKYLDAYKADELNATYRQQD